MGSISERGWINSRRPVDQIYVDDRNESFQAFGENSDRWKPCLVLVGLFIIEGEELCLKSFQLIILLALCLITNVLSRQGQ